MRVSIIQTDIEWGSVGFNHRGILHLMEGATPTDLIVLPEMFSTGFATNPEQIAEKEHLSLRWMQQQARHTDAAWCGSVATAENGLFFNRVYFVKPDGTYTIYDKRHLFTYSGEHERYESGRKRVTVEWRGMRILLQVCYDLRFPVFSRNKGDYDLALYVANWPDSRRHVWDTLLRARAIENQCYVVGVNRVGDDPQCHYDGGSVIVSPYGRTIVACPDNEPSLASAELSMEKLQAFRQKFPVLADADEFQLGR